MRGEDPTTGVSSCIANIDNGGEGGGRGDAIAQDYATLPRQNDSGTERG